MINNRRKKKFIGGLFNLVSSIYGASQQEKLAKEKAKNEQENLATKDAFTRANNLSNKFNTDTGIDDYYARTSFKCGGKVKKNKRRAGLGGSFNVMGMLDSSIGMIGNIAASSMQKNHDINYTPTNILIKDRNNKDNNLPITNDYNNQNTSVGIDRLKYYSRMKLGGKCRHK